MKKYIIPILLFVLFIPFYVNAETCDTDKITIEKIIVENKSDNVEELEKASASGKIINLNLSISNIGDNIKYKIIVKNDSSEDYELDKNNFNMNSNYIDYTFELDDNNIVKAKSSKVIYLSIKYKNSIPKDEFESGTYRDNNNITLGLSSNKIINNPKTGIQFCLYLIILVLVLCLAIYILLRNKKDSKLMIFIIAISIFAQVNIVYALCRVEIRIESSVTITKNRATDIIENLVIDADQNSTDIITGIEVSDSCENKLAYDGTVDNNLRYVGNNPCNYALFNDEVWRIIGVMKNVDDGTGKKETRIKIIRNMPLSEYYSWDSSSSDINSGYGVNDWTQADLMKELNGDYLNYNLTENKYWYNGRDNSKTGVYDYTSGLKQDAQEIIGKTKWYLGGMTGNGFYSSIKDGIGTSSFSYMSERGISVWGSELEHICNDGACPRATSWIGKVALMYPSDYGFAVGGNNRINCLNVPLDAFSNYYCSYSSWLWDPLAKQWLLASSSKRPHISYILHSIAGGEDNGDIMPESVSGNYSYVRPVVYLKARTLIKSGNGSLENPYEFN